MDRMLRGAGSPRWRARLPTFGRFQGTFILIRKLAPFIALAVAVSGSLAVSTESAEAKTSRTSSLKARNILVPPPPPYIPTIVPAALGMLPETQVTPADSPDSAIAEKEAKISRHSSHRARNYFVPPPPPYTPSILVSAMSTKNAGTATADIAMLDRSVNSYGNYLARNQGDIPQVGRSSLDVSRYLGIEKKAHKEIDQFDSQISNHEKEIGKLLNL